MLKVVYSEFSTFYCYALYHYADSHCSECLYTKCHDSLRCQQKHSSLPHHRVNYIKNIKQHLTLKNELIKGATTLGKYTLSIMTLNIMTFSITTLSIMTLSHYAECIFTECRGTFKWLNCQGLMLFNIFYVIYTLGPML
jgi:hypothetical protein